MRFDELPLHPDVRAGVAAAGYVHATEVQARTLPNTLLGESIIGQAQTGSGKTAAFMVAALQKLLTTDPKPGRKPSDPRVLAVAPTRELAVQILAEAERLGGQTGLRFHAVYGGVEYDRQRSAFDTGVDVLVGTPGRLIDFLKQKVYSFDALDMLIVDECDRLFDMGFIDDLRWMLRRMPPMAERQNLLFSATINFRVRELAWEWMNDPPLVAVDPDQNPPDEIDQKVFHVARSDKDRLLVGLLREQILREAGSRVLVFSNFRHGCERIRDLLELNGIPAVAISGALDQRQRIKALDQFKAGDVPVIVATDVASRGIHVDDVSHVINYDVPATPDDYVHRVGRTARAGASGTAWTLASEDTVENLPRIEEGLGIKIPVDWADEALLVQITRPPRRERERPGDRDRRPGGGRPGGRDSARSGRPGGDRKGPRPERPAPKAEPAAAAAAANKPADTPADKPAVAGESPAAPRKRRRRGRRKPDNGAGDQAAPGGSDA
jgi:ATP-dependent RNA helicase RhlB